METSIRSSFNDVSKAIGLYVQPEQLQVINDSINNVGEELIKKLNQFQFDTITGPLLDILTHLGKSTLSFLPYLNLTPHR